MAGKADLVNSIASNGEWPWQTTSAEWPWQGATADASTDIPATPAPGGSLDLTPLGG